MSQVWDYMSVHGVFFQLLGYVVASIGLPRELFQPKEKYAQRFWEQ